MSITLSTQLDAEIEEGPSVYKSDYFAENQAESGFKMERSDSVRAFTLSQSNRDVFESGRVSIVVWTPLHQ